MIFSPTRTTKKLESYARRYNLNLGIVRSPHNKYGLYFVTSINDRTLTNWRSLGWTAEEAKTRIVEVAAKV